MDDEYISSTAAAKMLEVSTASLSTYRKKYGISCKAGKKPGTWLYSVQSIKIWIARRNNDPNYKKYFLKGRRKMISLIPMTNKLIIPAEEWAKNPDTGIYEAIESARKDATNPLTIFVGKPTLGKIIGTPAEVEYYEHW